MKVYIIGAGPGNQKYLTQEAKDCIAGADLVIATGRLYAAFAHLNGNIVKKELAEIVPAVLEAREAANVAVLASGDGGFFSLAKSLLEKFGGIEVVFVPGLSSMQCLAARLGLNYEDARIVSLHGRAGSITPYAAYNHKVFVLTGGDIKAHDVIRELDEAGLSDLRVAVGENLGAADERVVSGTAAELRAERFGNLACLFVLNEHFVNPHSELGDDDFIRGSAPMSKRVVRSLALAALDIRPGDTVMDIGAGTGAIAICMARKAFEGTAWAIERGAGAVETLQQNRLKHGVYNLSIVEAEAPDGFNVLPTVDKVFIGGSHGRFGEIIDALLSRNPGVRVVCTAISLETLNEAVSAMSLRGMEPEVTCINAAHAHKTGGYRMMKAENPVYIISGGANAG